MQRATSLVAAAAIAIKPSTFICSLLALLISQPDVVLCVNLRTSTSTSTSPVPAAEWSALLDFKARITKWNTSDVPFEAWNASNLHNICKSWVGVACTPTPSGHHIAAINLAEFGLSGSLSPHLCNLTFLSTLNLSSNYISGGIPLELSSSLQFLDLNHNSLTGHIPPGIGNCTNLLYLDLRDNLLSGTIPSEIGSLFKLQYLWLTNNGLTGAIPLSLARCKNLLWLDLGQNLLTGGIHVLGNLTNLLWLVLNRNLLTGGIHVLGNLTNLNKATLARNNLRGGIPRSLGNCNRLVRLELSANQLSGPIPAELGQLTFMSMLLVWGNNLNGTIPRSLGNCTQLIFLELSVNQLSGFIPNEIMNLKHLASLTLTRNQLVGFEKPLIGFSNTTSLLRFYLGVNLVRGPIPPELGQLQGLQNLNLSDNRFSGTIPWDSLCNCTSLFSLALSNNHLTGGLSGEFMRRLSKLQVLFLDRNFLQGLIPDLGNLQILQLDLSFNQFNGTLPDSLANVLKHVVSFNLSHNALSGGLPPWLGELMMVQAMDLSYNHLVGTIPGSLSDCEELAYLNMSGNNLVGEIPPQLGTMSSLISMDLSNNHLTGTLPSTLAQSKNLSFMNVSFNNLKGPIPLFGVFKHLDPSCFQGNPDLCGLLLHKPCISHHRAQLAGWKISVLIAFASLLVTAALIVIICHKYRSSNHRIKPNADETFQNNVKTRRFSVEALSESTQNYSEENVLGKGARSVVYKGVLPNGEVIAVKKFRDGISAREALLQEVHILSKLRHRNLVSVLGYVLNLDVNALVLEFMPSGTLRQYLQECKNSNRLSLEMVFKVAHGVANALTYLHHEYDVVSVILHRDVKPSNILLDSEFEAHLADFGIARLAVGNMGIVSISSNINGSIGYMAPEFAYAAKITTKVDTFGFGVVVLEMVTGTGPTDELLQGVTLHEWVKQKLLSGVNMRDIVQASLLLSASSATTDLDMESRLRSLLHMAVVCTEFLPDKRPTMRTVKAYLESLNW